MAELPLAIDPPAAKFGIYLNLSSFFSPLLRLYPHIPCQFLCNCSQDLFLYLLRPIKKAIIFIDLGQVELQNL